MEAVVSLPVGNGLIAAACDALGVARATVYRHCARRAGPRAPSPSRPRPPRALTPEERQTVLDRLREPRFADLAPAEVYATLLDEGVYHCSIRTMYRILDDHAEVRERRDQLRHPVYTKPELLAEAPNQVWSWDITKLMGPAKWSYFYLYVILDIFSRRVVGWCVADADPVQGAVRRHPREAHRAARPTDPPRRSRRADEGYRLDAGRPRRHQVA
jgi:putative transposase